MGWRTTKLTLAAMIVLVATVPAPPLAARIPLSAEGKEIPTLAPVLKKVTPGVVNIATRGRMRPEQNPMFNDPFFRRFFDDPYFRRFFDLPQEPLERETQSVGSGVIVDAKNGYVLTNEHVIRNADEILVTLKDRRRLEAKLIGSDAATDVAVLKIKPDNLKAVPFGNSDDMEVGDFVIAIGNPFGLGQTVTSGIVSALGRTGLGIEGYEDFIQTDASINPGNSGGALMNLRGELIGINTAIIGPSGGNVGIGFAIPTNMARRVMEQIIAYGGVQRGQLGVHVQDLTPELAQLLEVKRTEGAVIAQIVPGSAAERAGLKVGDVIVAVGEDEVRNGAELRNKIGLLRVGEKVRLEIIRKGKSRKVELVIRKAPENRQKP